MADEKKSPKARKTTRKTTRKQTGQTTRQKAVSNPSELVKPVSSGLSSDTSSPGHAPLSPISLDASGQGSLFQGERKYAELDEVKAEDISEGLKSDGRQLDLAHQRADNSLKEQGLVVKANRFEAGQQQIIQSQQNIRAEVAKTAESVAKADSAEMKAAMAQINQRVTTAENLTAKEAAELRLAELDRTLEQVRAKASAYRQRRPIQDAELARLRGEL